MIIAQLTDLHLGMFASKQSCPNLPRLKTVMADINAKLRKPDLILLTGDLTEHGDVESYQVLKGIMEQAPCPVHYLMGNHDNRDNFFKVFPNAPQENGQLRYRLDLGDRHIIAMDSLEPGRHGGALNSNQAEWLSHQLEIAKGQPVFIALHHPPIETGIGWLTADNDEPWVKDMAKIISGYDNIEIIVAGHIHRNIRASFAGTQISVCPAVSAQLALELADIKPDAPDGRALLLDAPPAYGLHIWDDNGVTTHIEHSPMAPALIRYEGDYSKIVEHTMENLP